MRDVSGMRVGDPVTLVLHDTRITATFQGATPWGVNTTWGGFAAFTPFGSSKSWVEDSEGRVIARDVPDLLPVGDPPELE
jgi:hypothetical protein